ncbi:MAG TPA: glycosyltransferase [Methylomirabilota bacterium]|nr:glycosyltransferase [Methylomirabilota bacterium]
MKLRLVLEHRFQRTPDGQVWSAMFPRPVWSRYLRVFSEVCICARVREVPAVPAEMGRVTGEGVTFFGLPHYHGPWEYWRRRHEFRVAVRRIAEPGAACIVRVPGNVASEAIAALRRDGLPCAVEVVADPWDMFSPGSSTHPLRWFFRRMFTHATRRQCAQAQATLYVTEHALQRRYPPGHAPGMVTCGVSDVCLGDGAFVACARTRDSFTRRPLRLISVGSFNLLYKAQDVLVNAFARAVKHGLDGRLTFVGDGIYRPRIEALVARHRVLEGRVEFLGQLRGGEAVFEALDRSELFVLPSRQEGLPRAALEAMARGLPCIGSHVGGFPEILPEDAIVRPNDVKGLARCLLRLAADPDRLAAMSAQNLRRAADFHAEKLAVRQNAFYEEVSRLFGDFWARRGHPGRKPSCAGPEPLSHSAGVLPGVEQVA